MKPSLYNEDERYTEEANALHDAARNVLQPIFGKYASKFKAREISHIIQAVVMDFELNSVLTTSIKKPEQDE